MNQNIDRRRFLELTGLALLSTEVFELSISSDSCRELVESIRRQTLWSNLKGDSVTWFHPRACMVPDSNGRPQGLMTLQTISGSDYFGPVHWSTSIDMGKTWTQPKPIPSLGRQPVPKHDGLIQGVCDVVPEYHRQTKKVLALGHVVFYRGGRFARADQLARYPVYAVRDAKGDWSKAKKLLWDDPRGAFIYSNNCGQRINLPDGDILLAFTFGPQSNHRSVAGVRCSFDGETLAVQDVGPPLKHRFQRGLLEPSLTKFNDRFFMTIRAEDDRGYVSTSEDGLRWEAKKAWAWDDGTPLVMSTTQQHWLTHSDALFLVYTRKDTSNINVTRWRAPIFMARVDTNSPSLIKSTEQIVHPLVGDGVNKPDEVPLMGNFHVNHASPTESWVTVGSWLPRQESKGAVHLARIRWRKPNRLAGTH